MSNTTLQFIAPHCNKLHDTGTHCNRISVRLGFPGWRCHHSIKWFGSPCRVCMCIDAYILQTYGPDTHANIQTCIRVWICKQPIVCWVKVLTCNCMIIIERDIYVYMHMYIYTYIIYIHTYKHTCIYTHRQFFISHLGSRKPFPSSVYSFSKRPSCVGRLEQLRVSVGNFKTKRFTVYVSICVDMSRYNFY